MRGHLPSGFGWLMARLPLLPVELAGQRLLANVTAARPDIFARLEEFDGHAFAIDPVDCPFVFLITLRGRGASLRVVRTLAPGQATARIAAPLVLLLGMLDGAYDGDALFFARHLVIEGDTGAVLALSNALENAEPDPAAMLGVPERLAEPARRMVRAALGIIGPLVDAPPATGRPEAALSA